MDYIKGYCPHCGKALQVPSDLDEFSCLYCGARTNPKEIRKDISDELYQAEREFLRENLVQTVIRYPENYKKMTRKEFLPTFNDYEDENAKIVKHLDTCVRAYPSDSDECMQDICKELIDQIEDHLKAQPKWKSTRKQYDMLYATRVVLAIFLCPLVRKLELETAEDFCAELNKQWIVRFPAHKWSPGYFKVLEAGYKKRGFCFITTATCEHDGKADDCVELTAFRAFRDGWMLKNGFEADIQKYYEIAPAIVQCIDHCDDSALRYAEIREKWLNPCYQALQEDRNEDCRKLYSQMVETLTQKYLQ